MLKLLVAKHTHKLTDTDIQWIESMMLTQESIKKILPEIPKQHPIQIHYYHCDQVGTPLALIRDTGEMDWAIELDPFGNKIGRGYHATHRHPYKLPEHKTITGFKTKTHKGDGYNELYFDDENEKQLIRIHAEKDYDLKVKNVKNERIDFDHQVSIGNDQKTDVAHNRIITVEGEQHHTTKSNHIELREADSNLEIKGDFKTILVFWSNKSGHFSERI